MARDRVRIPAPLAQALRSLAPPVRTQIRRGLDRIADDPSVGKPLVGLLRGLHSHRVGRDRIVYRVEDAAQEILILHAGRRRTVYEEAERIRSDAEGGG